MTRVLLVDSEPAILEISKAHLESMYDFEVDTTCSPALALEILRGGQYEVVVSDHKPPTIDGIGLLEQIRNEELKTAFILFTRKTDESLALEALNRGADFYLNKTNGTRSEFAQLANMIKKVCCVNETQEALAHNVKRFRSLLENANDLILVVDPDNKILFVSPGSERIMGYRPEELTGKSLSELFHPLNKRMEHLEDPSSERGPGAKYKYEFKVQHKNGSWVAMEGIASVFADEADSPQIVINAWDVTALKDSEFLANRAASVLQTIANVHRSILRENNPDELAQAVCSSLVERGCYEMVWMGICDRDGNLATIAESGLGSDINALTETFEGDESVECCRKALTEGGLFEIEDSVSCGKCPLVQGKCGKGAICARLEYHGHIYGTITMVLPPEFVGIAEEAASFQTIVEDIAFAMNSAESRDMLRRSEENYRAIFERTGAAMAVVDEDTTINMVNEELARLSGYTRDQIEGKKSWTEMVPKDDLSKMREYHYTRRTDPDSVPRGYESRMTARDGTIRDVWVTVEMIPGSRQSVASIHDITEYKRTKKLLERQIEENKVLLASIQSGIERIGSPLIKVKSR